MRTSSIVRLAAVPILAAGCGSSTSEFCAGVGGYGLRVAVVDSLTGVPAAAGATLLTYDLALGGQRVDSVVGTQADAPLFGASDRAGRYTVVVRQAGYRDWTQSNVTVRPGCPTVIQVSLTARLARP